MRVIIASWAYQTQWEMYARHTCNMLKYWTSFLNKILELSFQIWISTKLKYFHSYWSSVTSRVGNLWIWWALFGLLCDLRRAYDVVDHIINIGIHENFGIRGPILKWFSSYLKGRIQYDQISHYGKKLLQIFGYAKPVYRRAQFWTLSPLIYLPMIYLPFSILKYRHKST